MKKTPPKTDAATVLIELHAQTFELFAPIRDWSNNAHVVGIMERREVFHSKGLPIRQGGSDSERKIGERWHDQLKASGAVSFALSAGKRTHWKLNDLPDWQITSLVGSYGIGPMLVAMRPIRTHQNAPHEPGNFVPETWLMGLDYDAAEAGQRLADLEEVLAPALRRDWVTSKSDIEGRVAYQITDAGRQVLDNTDRLPADEDLPAYDRAAGELYEVAIRSARAELKTAKPSTPSHCVIPLSAGCWPEDDERAPVPPVFTKAGKVRSAAAMTRAIRSLKTKRERKLDE
jgi:hypothetical protein